MIPVEIETIGASQLSPYVSFDSDLLGEGEQKVMKKKERKRVRMRMVEIFMAGFWWGLVCVWSGVALGLGRVGAAGAGQ